MPIKERNKKSSSSRKLNLLILILLCFTLGLAPYFPEPHLFGKIGWVAGGAKGMQLLDWFDLLLHGFPWLLLLVIFFRG
jgi:hypothetical protein